MTTTDVVVSQLDLELEGVTTVLPMRKVISAKGNPWYALHKRGTKPTPYGVRVAALADSLPTVATVHGIPVPMTPGVTSSGNPKTSGSTSITLDGVIYNVQVQVSRTPSGWNIIAKAFKQGGGSSAVAELGDLL